jgi:hypothetical protein
MAIKTFTTGEVLTAADTNTFLANSGLVLVASYTIGSGVTSTSCANAFNSTYDNYRIVVSGGVGSGLSSMALKLGASVTGYNSNVIYSTYAAPTVLVGTSSGTGEFGFAGYIGANFMQSTFDLISPNKAAWTTLSNSCWAAGTVMGSSNGTHQVATAYTDFSIGPNAVGITMTGGTVTVYGYRKG